eukprot:15436950-Alexandrium_andersonii.AAC.1
MRHEAHGLPTVFPLHSKLDSFPTPWPHRPWYAPQFLDPSRASFIGMIDTGERGSTTVLKLG